MTGYVLNAFDRDLIDEIHYCHDNFCSIDLRHVFVLYHDMCHIKNRPLMNTSLLWLLPIREFTTFSFALNVGHELV